MEGVYLELNGLRAMGLQTASVILPYPVLDPSFHTEDEYAAMFDFYRQVADALRQRGMGLVIENLVLVTEGYFSNWPLQRLEGFLNLGGDPGFDLAAFNVKRAAIARTIAMELAPDYLSVFNEPDTVARSSGIPQLGEIAEARKSLDVILAAPQDQRSLGLKVVAGVGSWLPDYLEYVASFVQTPMDDFDVHVFVANDGYLDPLTEIAQQRRVLEPVLEPLFPRLPAL